MMRNGRERGGEEGSLHRLEDVVVEVILQLFIAVIDQKLFVTEAEITGRKVSSQLQTCC
jgi:hypothetical protein